MFLFIVYFDYCGFVVCGCLSLFDLLWLFLCGWWVSTFALFFEFCLLVTSYDCLLTLRLLLIW